mgnify:CR=1 FL=1
MLAEAVKQGIWSAGGVPFEFGVPGLCGNIAVGHENCKYELAERDVVCSAIEIVSKINNFDGLVTLSLIHISEPTRQLMSSRMPSSA